MHHMGNLPQTVGAAVDAGRRCLVHRYFEDYGEDRLLVESTKGLSAEQQAEVRRADRCPSLFACRPDAWVTANGPR